MKSLIKNKKILIGCIFIIIGILICIFNLFIRQDKDEITKIKEAIEHVFFYLPDNEYDNLNNMSDYCKISMVYDTDYLKNDVYLSKNDYDKTVKSSYNSVKAYKTSNVLNSIKKILGESATINFNLNDDNDYDFLLEDNCKYGNKKLQILSYNESKKYLYSINDESSNDNNSKLYVKWDEPVYDGDTVTLKAYALLAIKNSEGNYDIYLDNDLSYKIDTISSNISYKIAKLYDRSFTYEFILKKENNNYIWTNYKIINIDEDTEIFD